MFGLGTWETIIILVVALVFLGPDKLPEVARTIGKGLGSLRRAMSSVRDEVGDVGIDMRKMTRPQTYLDDDLLDDEVREEATPERPPDEAAPYEDPTEEEPTAPRLWDRVPAGPPVKPVVLRPEPPPRPPQEGPPAAEAAPEGEADDGEAEVEVAAEVERGPRGPQPGPDEGDA